MVSPSWQKSSMSETHGMFVEDSPIMGIPNRQIPMGSVFVPRTEAVSCKVHTPRRRLMLASTEGTVCGKVSKSVEIVETKSENAHTPSRPITRSITILSDSKDRDSPAVKEALKITANNKKIEKRLIDNFEDDYSTRKKKMVIQSNPKASKPTTQNYSFRIRPENRFGGTINVFYNGDVISILNAKLNDAQKELFRSSCFGHFLQMKEMRIQHQIIHKMLMLEISQPNEDEMRFDLDGKILRFSIHDFCIVSGLKCVGDETLNLYKIGGCRLRDKYFSHLKNVYRNDVERIFIELPSDTPDEEVVKIGILYLITMFLFTTTQPNVVNNDVMRLVDSPHMNSFPWGKELFQLTFRSLKNAFKNVESIDGDNKVILTYRLYGFPLAFQIWVYESVPLLSKKFCTRISFGSPRMLNWRNNESRVTAANLEKFLAQLDEVDVAEVQPNDMEKGAAYYIGLGDRERITLRQPMSREHDNLIFREKKSKHPANASDNAINPCTNKLLHATTDLSEPHILKLMEEMANRVQQIHSNQIQIIEIQNEIKSNITNLESAFDSKYNTLMELISSGNTENQDAERSAKGQKSTKEAAASLNNRVSASVGKSISRFKESSAKRINVRKEIHKCVQPIDDSLDKSNNISTDVESPDEIQFTEEDLIKVDQIVKSVRSKKGKCIDQSTESAKISEEIHKGNSVDEYGVVKSLFLDQPHSHIPANAEALLSETIQPHTGVRHQAGPGYQKNAQYSLFPFSVVMADPGNDDVAAFESWFGDGYKPGLIKFKFPPSKDVIDPHLQFGPYVIASKTWWHELLEPNSFLRDSHVNICFYYFRKMLRYSRLKTFNCTTTDTYFGSMVRTAYKSCKDDIHSISNYKSLVEIASGDFIHCNTSWSEVDHVLIPVMMEKKAHWVLGHFHIHDRSLTVYNSSRGTIRDRVVANDMEALAYVLPCLMVKLNVWEPIVVNGIPHIESLGVITATGIRQDDYGHDCGLYVIKYAEFIIHQKIDSMFDKFDPKDSRTQLAVQLYKHGCEKRQKDYETDCDNVPRSVRRSRKRMSARNI